MGRFTLCSKQPCQEDLNCSKEARHDAIIRAARQVIPQINLDLELYRVTWHYGDEPCSKSRTLESLEDWSTEILDAQPISFHVGDRIAHPSEDNVDEALYEDEETQGDERSQAVKQRGIAESEDEYQVEGRGNRDESFEETNSAQDEEERSAAGDGQQTGGNDQGSDSAPFDGRAPQQPLNDLEDEKTEIPEATEDDGLVYIRMVYNWSKDTRIDPVRWKPHLLRFYRNTPIPRALGIIGQYVAERLTRHEKKEEGVVLWWAFALDKRSVARVASIGDLFGDRNILRTALAVEIKNMDGIRMPEIANLMVLVRSHGAYEMEFYRIGHLQVDNDKMIETERSLPEPYRRVERYTTFFWKRSSHGSEKWHTVQVPTWRLRGVEICDTDDAISSSKDVLERVEFDWQCDAGKPEWRIRESFEARQKDGLLQPFKESRPQYCFDTFLPREHGDLGIKAFPEPIISIALRFVSHLDSPDLKDLVFPSDAELATEKSDSYETTCKAIADLMFHYKAGNIPKLFKDPHNQDVDWDLKLWVMPQQYNALYQYHPSHDILWFLHQKLCDKKDMRLFMEVHVIPKTKADLSAQFTRLGRQIKLRNAK